MPVARGPSATAHGCLAGSCDEIVEWLGSRTSQIASNATAQCVPTRLHRHIVPHQVRIDDANVAELQPMTFAFLAMDAGPAKRTIVEHLTSWGVPFADCGMGLHRHENSLRGTVRMTAALPGRFDHTERRISYTDVAADEYDMNFQTADLNMLKRSAGGHQVEEDLWILR